MSQEHIVMAHTVNVGERTYLPGDRFDEESHVKRGELTERNVSLLKSHKHIVPLSRETYAMATARRLSTHPAPIGFTDAYLVEMGIIDAPAAAKPEPKPKPKVEAKPKAEKQVITHVPRNENSVQVGDYFRTPEKRGPRVLWSVTDAAGALLRAKAFQKPAAADEFIATLGKPASTGGESSGNQDSTKESGDGSDIQSGTDRSDQQGAAGIGGHDPHQS